MRTDLRIVVGMACAVALGGCAAAPTHRSADAFTAATAGCSPADPGSERRDPCGLPREVRAFVADRDLCDHFRGEPWPEGDADADRARRRELVDGVRTACAGIDRRLKELKARYADDAPIATLLGRYEATIEN